MFINYGELCRRLVALEKLFKVSSVQVFTTTAGQTVFATSRFKTTAASNVFIDGYLVTTGYTIVDNTIVFTVPIAEGSEVVITKI